MPYITNNEIAKINIEPSSVSLSSNPNFIQFDTISTGSDDLLPIKVVILTSAVKYQNATITITDNSSQTKYSFYATNNTANVNDNTFYLDQDRNVVAENVRQCIMKNNFLIANFDISLPPEVGQDGIPCNSNTLYMKPKRRDAISLIYITVDSSFASVDGQEAQSQISTASLFKIQYQVIGAGTQNVNKTIVLTEDANGCTNKIFGADDKSALLDNNVGNPNVSTTQKFLSTNINASEAESIYNCLQKLFFVKQYYTITFDNVSATITLQSTSVKNNYLFDTEYDKNYMKVTSNVEQLSAQPSHTKLQTGDEILVEIYENSGLFLGQRDAGKMGAYVTTFSKTYAGQPVWFDLNATSQIRYSDNCFSSIGWTDPGTVQSYRFVAKHNNGYNTRGFYISEMLYTLSGYCRDLQKNDLSDYVYSAQNNNTVRLLTHQPTLSYVKGQTQYLNFLLSDSDHDVPYPPRVNDIDNVDKIGVIYKLYSQSKSFLGRVVAYECDIKKLYVVNTLVFKLDKLLNDYPNTGSVEVFLARNGAAISAPLNFRVLPECLYSMKEFAFLNALGGWNSFGFGSVVQTDFKASSTVVFKSLTPNFRSNNSIETVFKKDATEQFSVQTPPIDAITAEWLKEMVTSVAVYELSARRYVIIDDFALKYNSGDNLFVIQMKYHYTDSYNANINIK